MCLPSVKNTKLTTECATAVERSRVEILEEPRKLRPWLDVHHVLCREQASEHSCDQGASRAYQNNGEERQDATQQPRQDS